MISYILSNYAGTKLEELQMEIKEIQSKYHQIKENIQKVIIGKSDVIELVFTTLLAGGNVLLEDVPGTGKTVLAKSLAKSMALCFNRIQFTPDLLPSDVTGINYYNAKEGEFVFRRGPVFSNILLADEINRATPRTQSGLLECMEEKQITVDGETRVLEKPFFVIATQNPVETAGTFPLPEAQLDRFMMELSMGLPTEEEEMQMLERFRQKNPIEELSSVCTKEEMLEMQQDIQKVEISNIVSRYLVQVVQSTRKNTKISVGVSPRGSLALLRSVQAYAAIQGRGYIIPEDIKYIAPYVMAHRITAGSSFYSREEKIELIKECIQLVEVPTESFK